MVEPTLLSWPNLLGLRVKALVSISINSVDILAQKDKLFKKNILEA